MSDLHSRQLESVDIRLCFTVISGKKFLHFIQLWALINEAFWQVLEGFLKQNPRTMQGFCWHFQLPDLDSNQDTQIQNLTYYHYTIGQWDCKYSFLSF